MPLLRSSVHTARKEHTCHRGHTISPGERYRVEVVFGRRWWDYGFEGALKTCAAHMKDESDG